MQRAEVSHPRTQPVPMTRREIPYPVRRATGALAESLAVRFLEARGHAVLARNLRVGSGEIDILAAIAGERVAVEVRSRWAVGKERPSDPVEAFGEAKARQVRKLAASLSPHLRTGRVDLIAVRFHDRGADILWVPRAG